MVTYSRSQVEESGGGMPVPGYYLAEVKSSEEKVAKSGAPYFNIQLKDVLTGQTLCFDSIMLGGRGIGIGHKKLVMLGAIDPNAVEWNIEAYHLIGKRAVVKIRHGTYVDKEGNTRKKAETDFDCADEGFAFGYAPEASWDTIDSDKKGGDCPF